MRDSIDEGKGSRGGRRAGENAEKIKRDLRRDWSGLAGDLILPRGWLLGRGPGR